MECPRLHWTRGRIEEGSGEPRTLEWIGIDDAGEPIARVVRIFWGWRRPRAVARDREARIIELHPSPPEGAGWLACVGGQVVGGAALPLQAVRTAEAALGVG